MSIDPKAHRKGEEGLFPDRSERCFQDGQYWYYKTREKIKIGPFDNIQLAAEGVSNFIDFIQLKPEFSKTLERYRNAA